MAKEEQKRDQPRVCYILGITRLWYQTCTSPSSPIQQDPAPAAGGGRQSISQLPRFPPPLPPSDSHRPSVINDITMTASDGEYSQQQQQQSYHGGQRPAYLSSQMSYSSQLQNQSPLPSPVGATHPAMHPPSSHLPAGAPSLHGQPGGPAGSVKSLPRPP